VAPAAPRASMCRPRARLARPRKQGCWADAAAYQPIAYRWARNLARYDAAETRRFVGFYDAAAGESATVLARATAVDIN
ncbi:MAG: hypothetical protein ABIT71_12865, partial [Vicinamibacteraceae bacterium]